MKALAAVVTAAVTVVGMLSGCVEATEAPNPPPGQDRSGGQGSGGSDGYSFLHTRDNGEPVRWSTCEPIRYVVRPKNEPEGAMRLLKDSVGRISDATGLEFSYEGRTDEAPNRNRKLYDPKRYGDRWAPVLIAYSDPSEYPRLRGQAAGFGGGALVRAGKSAPRYVSGLAVFDAEQMTSMGSEDAMRGVMLHELAHVIGLGHVDDRGQLMNPVQYGRQVTDLQKGDLKGLKVLGNGKCYEPIEPRAIRQ